MIVQVCAALLTIVAVHRATKYLLLRKFDLLPPNSLEREYDRICREQGKFNDDWIRRANRAPVPTEDEWAVVLLKVFCLALIVGLVSYFAVLRIPFAGVGGFITFMVVMLAGCILGTIGAYKVSLFESKWRAAVKKEFPDVDWVSFDSPPDPKM